MTPPREIVNDRLLLLFDRILIGALISCLVAVVYVIYLNPHDLTSRPLPVARHSTPEEMWLIRHLEELRPQGYFNPHKFEPPALILTKAHRHTIENATAALVAKIKYEGMRADFDGSEVTHWQLITRKADVEQIVRPMSCYFKESNSCPGRFDSNFRIRIWNDDDNEVVDLLIKTGERLVYAFDQNDMRYCYLCGGTEGDAFSGLMSKIQWIDFSIDDEDAVNKNSNKWVEFTNITYKHR